MRKQITDFRARNCMKKRQLLVGMPPNGPKNQSRPWLQISLGLGLQIAIVVWGAVISAQAQSIAAQSAPLAGEAGGSEGGKVHSLTLGQTLDRAMAQNAEVVLARYEQQRAAQATAAARDPFVPKLFAGSGLAYSSGFPLSIEGSAPSIVELRGIGSIYNKSQRLQLEKVREEGKAAAVATQEQQEAVAHRAATLFLAAARLQESERATRQQAETLQKVRQATAARVGAGSELPLEERRSQLKVRQAGQRADWLRLQRESTERDLAVLLGFPSGDRVVPAEAPQAVPMPHATEGTAIVAALQNSKELQRLEIALRAKQIEGRSFAAQRLPTVDLVAQYGLFAKFNNYEQFFQRFQRNNWQVGASVRIPVLPGVAYRAQAEAAGIEMAALRKRAEAARHRLANGARRAWQEIALRETAVEVAKLDLEVAREQVTVLLAQFEEGRVAQRQLEEARLQEQERWMALYDTRYELDVARLELLRSTGELASLLK